MSKKIVGVTVGTPLSPSSLRKKLKPVNTVNGVGPDESGNVDTPGAPTKLPNPNSLTINDQTYDGSKAVDMTPAVEAVVERKMMSVKRAGAKGDGSTDDTAAFQKAMSESRVVYVPGGTFKLSDTLVIRENCGLILSQDTVLKFTQTSGNCIEMRGSAVLRGNHAVLVAAYGLTGNVISMDTSLDGEPHNSIPPYEKSCPQWKRQRFVYDVNIIKPNANGFNRPLEDGNCSGTAIYMHCDGLASITWMWGIVMSGIRIAGGFSYGIHAYNVDDPNDGMVDDAWNHDMRIEAVIEGCEVGVELNNCNGAHLNVTIQPNTTPGGVKYAKQGFCLRDSRFVDMLRSRVWDWHVARNDREEYKHIALYGNCRGLLLDDFLVTEHPSIDIRDDIYTDTPSNFDTMTILQDPGNKNFKSVDGVPYFNNGTTNKKLMLASDKFTAEQMEFISPADGYYTYEPNFTNLVNGYEDGKYLAASGDVPALSGYVTTDFIPIDGAATHTYRIGGKDIWWNDSYGYCRIAWYDANKALKGSVMQHTKIGSNEYYPAWVDDDTVAAAFSTNELVSPPIGAAYFRVTAKGNGANLIVTVDEKQEYNAIWHGEPKRLDNSIKVKAENVIGLVGGASSWNDLKDKPFYSEVVEILPETTVEIDPETCMGIIPAEFTLEVGKEYTITYNGVKYIVSNGIEAEGAFAIGNYWVMDEENPVDTGEPFAIWYTPSEYDENDNPISYAWAIFPLDGSASVTLSITIEKVTPIEQKYVVNALPYWIVVTGEGDTNNPFVCNNTVAEVEAAIASGREVKLRQVGDDLLFTYFYHLSSREAYMALPAGRTHMLYFTRSSWVSGSDNVQLFLLPQEDGTYVASRNYNVD